MFHDTELDVWYNGWLLATVWVRQIWSVNFYSKKSNNKRRGVAILSNLIYDQRNHFLKSITPARLPPHLDLFETLHIYITCVLRT